MMCGQQPTFVLLPTQIKKKEAWAGDEKPPLGKAAWSVIAHTKCQIPCSEFILIDLT